mmetsp:Transcript_24708/g.34059  ORF Transcript_24708/g.34059 Transcript_24708/m.34059 type:complete len:244 (+) Transcript_24708:209-940(+)
MGGKGQEYFQTPLWNLLAKSLLLILMACEVRSEGDERKDNSSEKARNLFIFIFVPVFWVLSFWKVGSMWLHSKAFNRKMTKVQTAREDLTSLVKESHSKFPDQQIQIPPSGRYEGYYMFRKPRFYAVEQEQNFSMNILFLQNGTFTGTSNDYDNSYKIDGVFNINNGELRWVEVPEKIRSSGFMKLRFSTKECIAKPTSNSSSHTLTLEGDYFSHSASFSYPFYEKLKHSRPFTMSYCVGTRM